MFVLELPWGRFSATLERKESTGRLEGAPAEDNELKWAVDEWDGKGD
jgi:hypothetical protein